MPKTRAGTMCTLRRIAASLAAVTTIAAGMVTAVAAPAGATGNAYYVNCSAAGNGSGTQASPWNSTAAVNAVTFSPGDQILIDRGTTCSGNLAPKGSGNSSAAITIDAYGTGALPVIAAGSSANAAVELNDQSYWNIQNLKITGGVDYGVLITGNTANATLTNFNLTNLDVSAATGTSTVRAATPARCSSTRSAATRSSATPPSTASTRTTPRSPRASSSAAPTARTRRVPR